MGLVIRFNVMLIACATLRAQAVVPVSYIYTETTRYDSAAALNAGERFPAGAAIQLVSGGRKRAIAPGFAASADATVSFDGQRVVFSGKQKPADPWQIWEIPVAGGVPRCIVAGKEDAITPFYLPGDRIVYSRRTPAGFQLVTVALDGGAPLQLTYGPGNRVASDVLRDGRVLFEAAHDLYTVYSDGSGVESYRCDHGPDRRGARQLSSGDIVFESAGRLARFTSARAVQLPLTAAEGRVCRSGGRTLAAVLAGLLSTRFHRAIRSIPLASGAATAAEGPGAAGEAVQPVLVQSRPVPKRHPSALGNRQGANLLCLNVYTSKLPIVEGSIAKVRVWARNERRFPGHAGRGARGKGRLVLRQSALAKRPSASNWWTGPAKSPPPKRTGSGRAAANSASAWAATRVRSAPRRTPSPKCCSGAPTRSS